MCAYYSSDSDLDNLEVADDAQYNHLPTARSSNYMMPYDRQPMSPPPTARGRYVSPTVEDEEEPGYYAPPSHNGNKRRYEAPAAPSLHVQKRARPSARVEEYDDDVVAFEPVRSRGNQGALQAYQAPRSHSQEATRSIGDYVQLFQPGTTSISQPPSTKQTLSLISNNANNFFGGQLKPGQRITAAMNSKGQLVTRCTQMEGRKAVVSQVTTYGSAANQRRAPVQRPQAPTYRY